MATPSNSTVPMPQVGSPASKWTLAALSFGVIMATLDATVVNVAIATIQTELNISMSSLTWVVDGYYLTFASFLLAGGSLANRYGAKNVYLGGLVLFIIASLLCAMATSGAFLAAARLLQGAGAALFMPTSTSLLASAYSDEKQRAKMFGLWAAIASIGSGLGPVVGGVLVDLVSWESIFLINLPIGLIGFLIAYRVIAPSARRPSPLNIASHALGILALAGLSFALIEGHAYGWLSLPILGVLGLTVLTMTLFIRNERNGRVPVLPGPLFRDIRFSSATAAGFLLNFALFGGLFIMSLFLQQGRGSSPLITGLQMLPMMAVLFVGNIVFSRLSARLGVAKPMLGALAATTLGSLLMATTLSTETPYWQLAAIYSAINLGVGILMPANTTTVMMAAGREHGNMGGATLNVTRQIGALVGVAVMGIVIQNAADWYHGAVTGFWIMGLVYAITAVLVWFGRERQTRK